jgi:hypothetical protein
MSLHYTGAVLSQAAVRIRPAGRQLAIADLHYRLPPLSRRGKFFIISFYLQSVSAQSANYVKTYAVACRRVRSSTFL